jgi:hypothetical protein
MNSIFFILLITFLFLTSLSTYSVYADNCGSLQDCYGTIAIAIAVLAAIVIAVLLLPIILEAIAAVAVRAAAGIAARWAAKTAAEAAVTDILAAGAARVVVTGAASGGIATQVLSKVSGPSDGAKLIQAAGALSKLNMSAASKVDVMKNIMGKDKLDMSFTGFKETAEAYWMFSEQSRYAFQFVKDTGQIMYGKFDSSIGQFGDYIWRAL